MTEQSTEGDVSNATPDTEATTVDSTVTATPDDTDTDTTVQGSDSESDPEVFPREYVEKLRTENGKYRQRAGEADTLAKRLHTELVRATGRLADPTDLPFDAEHLADPDKMIGAIDELLGAKPHLATRRPSGDIGQGQRGPAAGSFSLLDTLKGLT